MRQLRQMLRLHHDGVSAREIGRTLGVARSTIQDNLARARAASIAWPLPAEWTDVATDDIPLLAKETAQHASVHAPASAKARRK